jgi:hypothetical protein
MGGGSFDMGSFRSYSYSVGKSVDSRGFVTSGQTFTSRRLDESLSPKNVIRECANSSEHPNTLPVILALDVTGSMGSACQRTAEALGTIMCNLLEEHKKDDIEFMVMGIGDMECDEAPVQVSQFESDVRIAKALDKIWMEHGGGGNSYESYSAAWLFGLKQTKLDCFDKQGKKGIIITMGDEPLNPVLRASAVKGFLGEEAKVQGDVDTKKLYEEASKKFDIYHISIDDESTSYRSYKGRIENTFGQLLGTRAKVASINALPNVIEACISETISARNGGTPVLNETNQSDDGTIKW